MCAPRIIYSNDHHDNTRDTPAAPRPHACPLPGCTRKFKRRFTLKEHIRTHTGEKSFQCPVPNCPKSFTTAGNLSRHKRTHPWLDTQFECLIVGCGCTFTSETKLERHVRMVHFGLSTHLCPYTHCGSAFSTSGNLNRHLRQHHSDDGSFPRPDASLERALCSPMTQHHFAAVDRSAVSPNTKNTVTGRAKSDVQSPVTVDSFAGSTKYHRGQLYCAASPLVLEPILPKSMLSVHFDDGDLVEALGFLFETNPY